MHLMKFSSTTSPSWLTLSVGFVVSTPSSCWKTSSGTSIGRGRLRPRRRAPEIGFTIVSMTVSLAVFIPSCSWADRQRLFHEFAVTIAGRSPACADAHADGAGLSGPTARRLTVTADREDFDGMLALYRRRQARSGSGYGAAAVVRDRPGRYLFIEIPKGFLLSEDTDGSGHWRRAQGSPSRAGEAPEGPRREVRRSHIQSNMSSCGPALPPTPATCSSASSPARSGRCRPTR
jgi:hypothetical protein